MSGVLFEGDKMNNVPDNNENPYEVRYCKCGVCHYCLTLEVTNNDNEDG